MNNINQRVLVTGGAGFIGSAMIRYLYKNTPHQILNIDKLSYASNLLSLLEVEKSERYQFIQLDIVDCTKLQETVNAYKPDVVMHFAAESHVDRSIKCADDFIYSNYVGTFNLLEACRLYSAQLDPEKRELFRLLHVSTDEVYGARQIADKPSDESASYAPGSPYAASKAGADHLVKAWYKTYQLPVLISNCSNNFGPWQYPEKLIPVVIKNALSGNSIPIYGDGNHIRDWLYVEDHVEALYTIACEGQIGESYNVGAHNEVKNIDLVTRICSILDDKIAHKPHGIVNFSQLVSHVKDRPGHDLRYSIDASKINSTLGWSAKTPFNKALEHTVSWYIDYFRQ